MAAGSGYQIQINSNSIASGFSLVNSFFNINNLFQKKKFFLRFPGCF